MSRAGYVLAGGQSSRMGRDKALLPFRGRLLGQHVADMAVAAAGSTVIVGDPEKYACLGYPVIPDRYPGEGPLGGILTALAHTEAEWNLVLACDMPSISAEFLSRLFETAELAGEPALVPAGLSGRLEPLCAVYSLSARGPLEQAFASGERRISAALEKIRTARVMITEMKPFENVNTPEDWAAHAGE